MSASKHKLLPVQALKSDAQLSKGQKTFNQSLKHIGKLREQLAAWDKAIPAYQEKYAREMVPLFESMTALQIDLVHALDQASGHKELTRNERSILRDLTVQLADEVLSACDDDEVKAIYNKHAQSDYDSDEAEQMQGMKHMLEQVFGFDLGDDEGLDSPEEFVRRMQAQAQEQHGRFTAQQHEEHQQREQQRTSRKKTARQLEKEERAEAEAKRLNQSVREIYRKLVRTLHPDRETDPQEHARKTALMQRINQAYEKQNLLQLLELQIEVEQVNPDVISHLDEERLRHYNSLLKMQVAELKEELMHVQMRFRAQFDISPFADLRPETLVRELDKAIRSVKQDRQEMENDRLALATPKGAKAWLKQFRRRSPSREFVPF